MNNYLIPGLSVVFSLLMPPVSGQENHTMDTLTQMVFRQEEILRQMKKIQFTGYLQAQYQLAEKEGIKTFSGGDFAENSASRFMIRRGRVKMTYAGNFSKFVTQVDITEKGISAKDIYLQINDPWLHSFGLTAGLFNRPFGNEIIMSSGVRESPERARVFQTLFPGERDGGVMVFFQPNSKTRLNWLEAEAGLFNGTGVAADFDSHKDFLGHVSVTKESHTLFSALSLGLSYYHGHWQSGTEKYYKRLVTAYDGFKAFWPDSARTHYSGRRIYYGISSKVAIKTYLGTTTLRGEYLTGIHAGTSESTVSPSSQPKGKAVNFADLITGKITTVTPSLPAVERYFAGGLVYLVQTILNTRHQIVFKYDMYDPNIRAGSTDIGKTGSGSMASLTAADLRYDTYGIGYILNYDSNLKLMIYYDIVRNEKTSLEGFEKDLPDNVLTIRLQYKF